MTCAEFRRWMSRSPDEATVAVLGAFARHAASCPSCDKALDDGAAREDALGLPPVTAAELARDEALLQRVLADPESGFGPSQGGVPR